MKKFGFVFRIALSSLFILMNTGCTTTPYETLYIQKYDGAGKLGKPYQMTDETFVIKINQHSDGYWFGSYHPWLDDTYRHIGLVDEDGNLLHFRSKAAFELEILKYGYEIVPSEHDFAFYSLRKIN
jgi:hypothetical protein